METNNKNKTKQNKAKISTKTNTNKTTTSTHSLGILDHLLDLVLGQAARRLDHNLLLLARALVTCRHVDNAVGVNVERHLDLCGGDEGVREGRSDTHTHTHTHTRTHTHT